MLPRIMIREDEEIASMVTKRFQDEGVDIRTEHIAKEVVIRDNRKYSSLRT